MSTVRARVIGGRLVVDEPSTLPEGTVLDLVVDDEGDDLPDEECRALDARLEQSLESAGESRNRPVEEILAELRSRARE